MPQLADATIGWIAMTSMSKKQKPNASCSRDVPRSAVASTRISVYSNHARYGNELHFAQTQALVDSELTGRKVKKPHGNCVNKTSVKTNI